MSINKRVLIITLLMIIFSCNIGYSKIVDCSSILETSNSIKTFNLEFDNAYIKKSNGVNINDSIVKIMQNKKNIYISISDLSYPGAGAVISANIINNGNIPAKINSINVLGLNENSVIKVKLVEGKDKIINPNEKTNINIMVDWDRNCNRNVDENQNFIINLNYIQAY